jgi:hypothetical protein
MGIILNIGKRLGIIIFVCMVLLLAAWRIDRTYFHPYQPEREAQIRDDVTYTQDERRVPPKRRHMEKTRSSSYGRV